MITDSEGARFLQWGLPRLKLRWAGFRKVRRQVYKRIGRRLRQLGLPSLEAYRSYLETHPDEWGALDTLCWISISRFYRDRDVFQRLEEEVLPQLANMAWARGDSELRCWSAGCAGGEEPYTLAILWLKRVAPSFPAVHLQIIATDIDTAAVERARRGCYRPSSLKQLPEEMRAQAFIRTDDELCLKGEYRAAVTFAKEDIRKGAPEGRFHLILCRNLVFTYFDEELQRDIMRRLTASLEPGAALIVGKRERLPEGPWELEPWSERLGSYRKTSPSSAPARENQRL